MNLHQIVSGAIGTINPFLPVTVQKSTGYTTDATGRRTPQFTNISTTGQVQALSGDDIKQLTNLGIAIQGVMRAVYLNGDWQGLVRYDKTGGDMMLFVRPGRSVADTWRVTQVLETWPDWCKVVVTLQDLTSQPF